MVRMLSHKEAKAKGWIIERGNHYGTRGSGTDSAHRWYARHESAQFDDRRTGFRTIADALVAISLHEAGV